MHTWVRRGLRTAFVTGGLLMLGTGIASADENVNPDLPPSSVDAGVSVPVHTGQVPLGTTAQSNAAKSLGQKATAPARPAAAAPVRSAAGRANPLVRQAQPFAQRVDAPKVTTPKVTDQPVVDRSSTLSGTLTPVQMATPMRTANDGVTGWTRSPLRPSSITGSNNANQTANQTMSGVLAKDTPRGDQPVVHNGPFATATSRTLPARVDRTVAGNPVTNNAVNNSSLPSSALSGNTLPNNATGNSPMAQRLPSAPQNGTLPGAPVVPQIKGIGLFDEPQAQPAPATVGALPSAPTATSARHAVHGVSPRLPVRYQAEVPTPAAVPTEQSNQVLSHSSLDSLPSGLLGGLLTGLVPKAQQAVPAQTVQSQSIALPSGSTLPSVPAVGQVQNRITSLPVTGAGGLPTAQTQSLPATPVGQLPTEPTVPDPAPVLQDVSSAFSHAQIHPSEAPTSVMRSVRALDSSPLGTLPSGPGAPTVRDVWSAPETQNVAATVPATQSAVMPFADVPTTALPTPIADLIGPLDSSSLTARPSASKVDDGVGSLFDQLGISQLTGAPSSVRHSIDGSPLRTAATASGLLDTVSDKASSALPATQAEVPSSAPRVPSPDQVTGAVSGSPTLPQTGGLLDEAVSQVPVLRSVVAPLSAASAASRVVKFEGKSVLGSLPSDPTAGATHAVPELTAVPNSVGSSVNNSPYGAVPAAPPVPTVPPVGSLADDAADVASSPTHAARLTQLRTTDVDTADLPSAPVGSVSYSPAGRMFGVPTVRAAADSSLAAIPVEQLAEVPGTVSDSVNESPFASLPGDPRVPRVPSVPETVVRTSSQPPVSYVTGEPASAAHATKVFGKPSNALPGVSDADGIAGVLPVVQDLFPRI
jgi:hypothetical protein